MIDPHPSPANPAFKDRAPEHQPIVDAFTDLPQAEGERPAKGEVDANDMVAQGGE